MPRKPNTELRRQQIVDGLLRTIAAQGYTGATIQAIASASGLAPGLVHYHFRDKREILVTLVEAGLVTMAMSSTTTKPALCYRAAGPSP